MLRSVKSQIILALSAIIIAVMGATAYLLIDQKTREINQDIFQKAISFAELTHERIISSFESNYQEGATVNFERELAQIYSLNRDIEGLSIYNYSGEALYQSEALESAFKPNLERIQAVFPSVRTADENRIVYLEQIDSRLRYTDFNGQEVNEVQDTEQVQNIVYPFRDPNDITRGFSLVYEVSYNSLDQLIQQMIMRISAIAVVGIIISLLVAFLLANGITAPIKTLSRGAEKIGKGDLKTRIPIKSKSEVGLLAKTFNEMAVELEKTTEVRIENEKNAKEFELAVEIQQDLLPTDLPEIQGLDIAASLMAASQVGGDCYDFIPLKDQKKLLFYIADVTGHGVGAGLVSAINNALIPALIEHYGNIQDLVIELNRLLKLKTGSSIFVTMVMAMWDEVTNTIQFTQAGHNPVVHYHAASQKANTLSPGGVALGMVGDISEVIKSEQVKMEKGDVFILYTDGIPEAWKNDKENYGMERFLASIEKNVQLESAQAIHNGLIKDVKMYMGDHPQADDITLLVVKRTA